MPKDNKKRKPRQKQRQRQKQKQNVRQNVRVNVSAAGGLGGQGGYMTPQYIPPVIHQSIPSSFRDTRGEDVILQRLSEIAEKFNEKPQPVEKLPPDIPLPLDYNDSAVDANQNNQLVAQVYRSRPQPNDNLLSELPFNNAPSFDFINNTSKPKINVLRDNKAIAKKAAETRKRNKEAKAAAAANDISFEPEEDAGITDLQQSLTAAEQELKTIAPSPSVKERVANIEKKSPMKTRSKNKNI